MLVPARRSAFTSTSGLVEFTHSYTVFKNAGCSVTVASPKGGLVREKELTTVARRVRALFTATPPMLLLAFSPQQFQTCASVLVDYRVCVQGPADSQGFAFYANDPDSKPLVRACLFVPPTAGRGWLPCTPARWLPSRSSGVHSQLPEGPAPSPSRSPIASSPSPSLACRSRAPPSN